ncbi:glycosyltransferase family 2 protein [Sphingomonas faeni]
MSLQDNLSEPRYLLNKRRALVFVDSGRNGGYAFGNNVGIGLALQQAATAYVWILNADTVVPAAQTLDALIARMDEDITIGLCGATVAYLGLNDTVQTRGGGRFEQWRSRSMPIGAGERTDAPVDINAIETELAYINGAATFARRAFIETVGLMSEDYFLYFEEFDWARQGRKAFRLGYAPKALVLHQVGGSIGTDDFGASSALSTFYLTRNRIKFLARHFPRCLPVAVVDEVIALIRNWRRGQIPQARARLRALTGRCYNG